MIIGVDIDNIVYGTSTSVLNVHYENTGERLHLSDIKSYHIENYVSEEYREEFYRIFTDKRVWKGVELFPHCVDVIKRLHDKGHDIHFITATETANIHKKFRFLSRTFPFINVRKKLITTQNKQMIKCDVLIDDYEKNLVGGDYHGILFNYPWNENFDDAAHDNIFRVNDWTQVEDVVEFIERLRYGD